MCRVSIKPVQNEGLLFQGDEPFDNRLFRGIGKGL